MQKRSNFASVEVNQILFHVETYMEMLDKRIYFMLRFQPIFRNRQITLWATFLTFPVHL